MRSLQVLMRLRSHTGTCIVKFPPRNISVEPINGKINFAQMGRYGLHCEQTCRNNFERKKSECIEWLTLNVAYANCYFDKSGRKAIAISRLQQFVV